jgi:uncharacterized protein (TIRG00374 family)
MAKIKIWMIVLIAIVIYIVIGIYADFEELLSSMQSFQWTYLCALFILTFTNYLLRFLKWDFFLKRARVKLKLKDNLFVFFSGLSMIVTPGKIGEIWKGWLIRDNNGEKLSVTIPVVIIERITDVTGLIILAAIGVAYYREGVLLIVVLLILLVILLFLIRSKNLSDKIISILERRTIKYGGEIRTIHETFERTSKPKDLITMSFLSAFAWFFECLGLYLVVIGFGQSISITQATFVFSFASLAGAISMIPGGLGVAEATIFGLLQFFGIQQSLSVAIAIIVRFGTLWFGAIMGLVVYLLFRKKMLKNKKLNGESV